MARIGFRGERLDIQARQGSTLGPFIVTLTNPDTSPVNLTGSIIRGQVRKNALDTVKVADFTVVIISAIAGQFSFEIPHSVTSAIPAGEFQMDPNSIYQWDLELEDSTGRITPLYFGEYLNFREVTRVT